MSLRRSILKVSAYFDVFDYPLTADEIGFFMDREISVNALKAALDKLTNTPEKVAADQLAALTAKVAAMEAANAAQAAVSQQPQANTPAS